MANIPVRILQDKNKQPFFPMSILESIFVNGTDKNLKQVLEEIYTKEEIDLLMLTLLSRFKTANSVSELPTTDVTDGNVYVVNDGTKFEMYYYYQGAWRMLTQKGASFQYNWRGTELGVKTDEEEEYTYVDLEGPTYTITEADYKAIAKIVKDSYVDGNGVLY